MRRLLTSLLLAFLVIPSNAGAAELIVVRQPGCYWCMLWDEELASIYAKTQEGRFAPIRDVDIRGKLPPYLKKPASMTPTFILVENEREVGRIVGYPGKEFFWGLLSDILAKSSFKRDRDN